MNSHLFYEFGGSKNISKGIVNKNTLENIRLENSINFSSVLKNGGLGIHNEFGYGNFKTPKVTFLKDGTAILEYDITLYKNDFNDDFDWEFEYQNRDILNTFLYNSLESCLLFHYPQSSTWFCQFLSMQIYDDRGYIIGTKTTLTNNQNISYLFTKNKQSTDDYHIIIDKNIKRITSFNYEKQTWKMEGYYVLKNIGSQPYQLLIHFIFKDDLNN